MPVPAVAVYILYPGTEEVSRLEVIPAEKVAVIVKKYPQAASYTPSPIL